MRFASNMCNFCDSFCCYCTCYVSSLSFHHIPIFFLEKRCPACDEDCPVAACEEVQEQGMWLYVWKEKEGLGEGEEARSDFPHTREGETWIQSRYLHCRDTLKTSK